MQIRHTRPEDLPAMQEIFADARAFMRENGNPDQWGDRFPTREMLVMKFCRMGLMTVILLMHIFIFWI